MTLGIFCKDVHLGDETFSRGLIKYWCVAKYWQELPIVLDNVCSVAGSELY